MCDSLFSYLRKARLSAIELPTFLLQTAKIIFLETTMKKRPVGRPLKKIKASDKRVTIGVRIAPRLKRQLMTDAERTGRSLSQEAEMRLEQSYDREWVAKFVMAVMEQRKEEEGK
jgi:hypothetical protein